MITIHSNCLIIKDFKINNTHQILEKATKQRLLHQLFLQTKFITKSSHNLLNIIHLHLRCIKIRWSHQLIISLVSHQIIIIIISQMNHKWVDMIADHFQEELMDHLEITLDSFQVIIVTQVTNQEIELFLHRVVWKEDIRLRTILKTMIEEIRIIILKMTWETETILLSLKEEIKMILQGMKDMIEIIQMMKEEIWIIHKITTTIIIIIHNKIHDKTGIILKITGIEMTLTKLEDTIIIRRIIIIESEMTPMMIEEIQEILIKMIEYHIKIHQIDFHREIKIK